jgi:hypothetical protein
MQSKSEPDHDTGKRLLIGVYQEESTAEKVLHRLIDRDFPMDRISIFGKAQSSGDDPLGLYYPGIGDRMKGWGKMGAFWGGLWGLFTGAAGMFLIPGVGPVLAAGPLVEALAGALAGAGLGGGAMAGAAALSEFTVALHRSGVPEEKLEAMQEALDRGCYLVMLILSEEEVSGWQKVIREAGPVSCEDFPYYTSAA